MSFSIFRICCFIGLALTAAGVLGSAWRYRGREGERYSLLNHFISELGEVGVTPSAWAFNSAMIASGLFTLPYMIGLGLKVNSLLGWLAVAAGLAASLAVIGVGFFPMNNLVAHTRVATAYFRAGLVMVFLFGLAILFQPVERLAIPRAATLLSLPAVGAFASFLFIVKPRPPAGADGSRLDPLEKPARPRVWIYAILEWSVFFCTLLWLFGMAFFL